ncbi:hypothetical protein HOLleu_35688 [Holothuria leucospilota]|uniref:CCHC-type domain-containing protein n=1 Tax=Holothuria leucospilota TaxID=206669 RepID=A0A9Q0YIT7_HOLLE|nr:hypothetical protein HOLleu_35688 [Holothuria leucospilota]
MPGGRDSTIVKLEFASGTRVSPPQAFTTMKNKGIQVKEIEMLQALAARNTYDPKFKSDAARDKGVDKRDTKPGLFPTDVVASACRWGMTRQCPNEVRCNLCGEEGHVSGACPTSYSAHASADVEQAPEPWQAGPDIPLRNWRRQHKK